MPGSRPRVATTSRNIGTSLGVAIVGSILSSHLSGMFAADFIAASRPALWVIVGFGATVFVESAGALGGDLGDAGRRSHRIQVHAAGNQRR